MRTKRIVCLVLAMAMVLSLFTWVGIPVSAQDSVLDDLLNGTTGNNETATPGQLTTADVQNFGYGYNVASGKPLQKSNLLKNPILDMSNPELLASLKVSDYTLQQHENEVFFSARELSNYFGTSYGGGIGSKIVAVSIDIDTMFSREEAVENAISERYELYYSYIEKKQVWTELSVSQLRNYLTEEFKAAVAAIDSEEKAITFIQTYGTHLFPGYRLGGKMTVTNYMTTSEDSFSVAEGLKLYSKVSAAIGNAGANSTFSFEERYEKREKTSTQKSSYRYSSIGGITTAGLSINELFHYHESVIGNGNFAYERWEKALDRHENLDILGVAEGKSAIPIWELLPQTSETLQARGYILSAYATLCGDKLSEYNAMYPYLDREFADDKGTATVGEGEITEFITSLGNVVWTPTTVEDGDDYTVVTGSEIYFTSATTGVAKENINWRVTGGSANVQTIDGINGVFKVTGAVDNEFIIGLYDGDIKLDEISFKILKKDFSGGQGTAEDPYIISTVEELQTLLNQSKWWKSNFHFRLVNDINASTLKISKAMSKTEAFEATLDGGYHTIKNYKCTDNSYPTPTNTDIGIGLFGYNRGTIKNLKLDGIEITVNNPDNAYYFYMYGGALVGINGGEIVNCTVSNSTIDIRKTYTKSDSEKNENVFYVACGGLVGNNQGTVKTSGVVNVNVRAQFNAKIEDDIKPYTVAGGLVGLLYNNGTIDNCFTSFVEGENGTRLVSQVSGVKGESEPVAHTYAGGLIGWTVKTASASPKVANCVVDIPSRMYANPSACDADTIMSAGTVVGRNEGLYDNTTSISSCYVLNTTKRPNIKANDGHAPVNNGAGGGIALTTSGSDTVILKNSVKYADVSATLDEDIWAADAKGNATVAELDVTKITVEGATVIYPYGTAWSPVGTTVKTVTRSGIEKKPLAYIVARGGFKENELGSYTVTTKAAGKSLASTVTVEKCKIVSLTASDKSENALYMGVPYDPTTRELEIIAILSNGEKISLNSQKNLAYVEYPSGDYTVSQDVLEFGENKIEITYGTLKTSFIVKAIENKVESIVIDTQPDNLNYQIGASFKTDGMVVKAIYTDGTVKTVNNKDLEIIGSTVVEGENKVIVSYGEYKRQEINVRGYEALTIKSQPTTTEFEVGMAIDLSGMVLSYTADGENYVDIFPESCRLSADTLSQIGANVITVTYAGKSVDLTMTGIERKYVVKFIDFYGNVISEERYSSGATVTQPTPPEVDGFVFTSWDRDVTVVNGDATYTAIYQKNKYTITFVGFDGTTIATYELEHGAKVTAPTAPKVEGYTFISWDKEVVDANATVTYTAVYEKNKYTVTFIGFDGTTIAIYELEHGAKITAPNAPKVEGYTFVSWDKQITDAFANATYTAVYEKDEEPENPNPENPNPENPNPENPNPDVPEKVKGDFDGDGKITVKDAVVLLQYVHFKDVAIDNVADLNGDGKITSDDAIYLNNYLIDPNTYPIK